MHIEESVKLDFKDVLIRPKRSTLTSRSDVDISRSFIFHHSKKSFHGIPIIAANMDATGTFEMAHALGRHGLSTALHKHYPKETLIDFFQSLPSSGLAASSVFYSMGITQSDYEKFCAVMRRAATGSNICASMWPTAIRKASSISSRKCAATFRQ